MENELQKLGWKMIDELTSENRELEARVKNNAALLESLIGRCGKPPATDPKNMILSFLSSNVGKSFITPELSEELGIDGAETREAVRNLLRMGKIRKKNFSEDKKYKGRGRRPQFEYYHDKATASKD